MCTVSFVPQGSSFVITSNRDEHISRPTAFEPREESLNGRKVIFPKDPKAGGTWFAVNENGVAIVLLNGAFKRHISKGNYAKSRGLVVLDVIGQENPESYVQDMELENIEPFTLLVFQEERLTEFRWDGKTKFLKKLDSSRPQIWSSVTLYDDEVIRHRENLFSTFIQESGEITDTDIVNFHSNNHGDHENGFIIDRGTGLKTFSVTQALLEPNGITLRHLDLLEDKSHTISTPKLALNP